MKQLTEPNGEPYQRGDKTPQQLTLEMEHWTERPARGLNDEATPTPTPGPVTLNFTPMPKEVQEKIDAEKSAKEKAERERFNKQEAEREANGDFSHAPGLTPEQREAAAIRWAEKNAEQSIKGAKPAPQ